MKKKNVDLIVAYSNRNEQFTRICELLTTYPETK